MYKRKNLQLFYLLKNLQILLFNTLYNSNNKNKSLRKILFWLTKSNNIYLKWHDKGQFQLFTPSLTFNTKYTEGNVLTRFYFIYTRVVYLVLTKWEKIVLLKFVTIINLERWIKYTRVFCEFIQYIRFLCLLLIHYIRYKFSFFFELWI